MDLSHPAFKSQNKLYVINGNGSIENLKNLTKCKGKNLSAIKKMRLSSVKTLLRIISNKPFKNQVKI
jgi:hypothetical protein